MNILPAQEREQLLVGFNQTEVAYPEGLVHELFEEQVRLNPEATAVVYGDASLSYAELNLRANQIAHRLIALGVKPDDRVAICVQRSLEMVVGIMGILKSGAAYVPLDPSYPEERLAYMVQDSAPKAMLSHAQVEAGLLRRLVQAGTEIALLRLDPQADVWQDSLALTHNPDPRLLGLLPTHLAYVIYTSGSTGMPKGVATSHGGLTASTSVRHVKYKPIVAALLVPSFAFDSSVAVMFWTLTAGSRLVLTETSSARDPQTLAALVQRHAVDTWLSVPSVYHTMLSLVDASHLASLRTVVVAGEPLVPAVGRNHYSKLTNARLYNEYGPTEVTVWCTVASVEPETADSPSIGRSLSTTPIYLLDASGQPVPLGAIGELHVGGVQVARGYLNRPELTAERFLADPFSAKPGARMYKTGDLGRYRADGAIEYLGRNDFQVKIRGFRIELGEIEAQLSQCAGVREAAVLAREQGDGHKQLVAYLTAHEGTVLELEAIRTELQARLPEYMVPAAFVRLPKLPLTPNGKLDRKALPAPDDAAYARNSYEAPQGPIEEAIAAIWSQVC